MAASSDFDRRWFKQVRDNVHGDIFLDKLVLKFIDTEQFQRLRYLKQLGLTDMVYPGAVHSRFEHSLGVHFLAGEAIEKIAKYQGSELGIDRDDINTVKLAGLLHDVGHGPFSHLFEREFLPVFLNGQTWSHEDMSVKMIDCIVDEHHVEIDPNFLKKVKKMIIASSERVPEKSANEKSFLYDIVANGRTGIDVDKFDYIVRDSRACGLICNFEFQRLMETMRVLDDEICFRAKEYRTIHKLFATRADLHRTVYTHAKVKAIDLMVVDALIKANDNMSIVSKIHDPATFWKLDDSILRMIEVSPDPELQESKDLVQRIRRRDLYQFCNEFSVPKASLDHFKEITSQDIICSQNAGGVSLREEDVAVSNIKIDLTRGRKNPLERVNFYQDFESTEKFPIQDDRVSHLLPTFYQDMIVRVYSKKPELVREVSEAFEIFQVKKYGSKLQLSLKFIDTPQFQRLRDLKQLDLAHFIYPGAGHFRFEHSGEGSLSAMILRQSSSLGRDLLHTKPQRDPAINLEHQKRITPSTPRRFLRRPEGLTKPSTQHGRPSSEVPSGSKAENGDRGPAGKGSHGLAWTNHYLALGNW
ncbi:hypothetical protein FNV43_RR26016 [Rhamnella rubrinervis]|uniref:HD/PDEase domain-containing protein n=1 Tax=Rhamnella rubrinervis TaxID=2594499 RepID=A0A8K0DIX1_9ROSA|nr:hypothetical protein FNV43_RR26016 [Rhamnella rubrinervis]